MSTSVYRAQPARDLAEVIRSADEARTFTAISIVRAQVDRYLNPPSNTPHGLEYAFYLLGDVHGKCVLDLGCGKGENLIPLAEHKGYVSGIDISPDLVGLAEKRVAVAGVNAQVAVGSAYATGFPDESFDVVFCVALIHHLEIPRVHDEIWRILKNGGYVVLAEPIRFSASYDKIRKLLPAHKLISEYEHPLTAAEFGCMTKSFVSEQLRYFRLPFVPLMQRLFGRPSTSCLGLSAWLIDNVPALRHFATSVVVRLRKTY